MLYFYVTYKLFKWLYKMLSSSELLTTPPTYYLNSLFKTRKLLKIPNIRCRSRQRIIYPANIKSSVFTRQKNTLPRAAAYIGGSETTQDR